MMDVHVFTLISCLFGFLALEHCRLRVSDYRNVIINSNEPPPDADGVIHIPHATEVHFSCAEGHYLLHRNEQTPHCQMGVLQGLLAVPACYLGIIRSSINEGDKPKFVALPVWKVSEEKS